MGEYIDRTQLEPDTEWSEYYDDFISYSQSQINSSPKADVIEREKINKAIEEIKDASYVFYGVVINLKDVLDILKRHIGE